MPRLLTKRTYSISVLVLALTIPAAAFAAPENGSPSARIGLADAVPAPLIEPGVSLRVEMRRAARRFRKARRARLRRERTAAFASLGVSNATLESIASCESGGDPTAVSSNGSYRGKYQFDYGTWESVGGSGDPAAASEAEQDYRAALLYTQSGSSPWPICG